MFFLRDGVEQLKKKIKNLNQEPLNSNFVLQIKQIILIFRGNKPRQKYFWQGLLEK